VDSRRAESFSDGVFAVAITVLVFNLLTIHLPRSSHELLSHWPQYVAYVVSFLTIGIMWLNHHTVLSHVSRVDRTTLVLNMFLLMGVVAVPFPTALAADALSLPGGKASAASTQVAAVVYGVVLIEISVAFSIMWNYLAARQDSLAARPVRASLGSTLRFGAGLLGYVVATAMAAISASLADAALAIYGALAVYYLFEHLPGPAADDSEQEAQASARKAPSAG
jgi:uncharacterized membrane protein